MTEETGDSRPPAFSNHAGQRPAIEEKRFNIWPFAPGSFSSNGLLILAVLYTLFLASDFFIPIFAAAVLNLVLSPAIRSFGRIGVTAPLGAALLVLCVSASVTLGFLSLAQPASEWIAQLPGAVAEIERKLSVLREPVEEVKRATEEMEEAIEVEGSRSDRAVEVVMKRESVFEQLFGTVRQIGAQVGICLILLFFLLASDHLLREKLVRVMPTLSDKKRALQITLQIERDVSGYLFTISAINAILGCLVGVTMLALGMPSPLLWGVMAGVLNFIPYFGAVAGVVIVAGVSILSFDTLGQAALAPAAYGLINFVEAQFLTPLVLGRRLTLNPIIIFVAVVFWGWLWGVPGALMAVPILVTVKGVCERIDRLQALDEFLSGRQARPP